MTTAAERRTRSVCAVFSPVDRFVRDRGVDGEAAARLPGGPLRFAVTALDDGSGRRPLREGWSLLVRQNTAGLYLSTGVLRAPDGGGVRPVTGRAVRLDMAIDGPAYRRVDVLNIALVNLDPVGPVVAPVPVEVELHPGYGYPFPYPQQRYGLLRGAVLRAPRGPGVPGTTVVATAGPTPFPGDTYVTDPSGQFCVVVPAGRTGRVSITARTPTGATGTAAVDVASSSAVAVPPFILP
jgi:hypothetical protein